MKKEGCGRMSQTTLYKKISMVGYRKVIKQGIIRVSPGPFLFLYVISIFCHVVYI